MGLLSSSVSVTRYKVEGKPAEPVLERIADGLKKNVIVEIENDVAEKSVGWTSFGNPFKPDFEGSSFVLGTYLVFSLRIDKKAISSRLIKKLCDEEFAKRLAESGRERISRSEKKAVREQIVNSLSLRIPATPSLYDLVWSMEEEGLWFFSNQKAANEELETLFSKSFDLILTRLFPYTLADMTAGLSDAERSLLSELSPARFTE